MNIQPGTIGNLYSQTTPDTGWRPPESLPVLDDRYKKIGFDCETDGLDWRGKSQTIGWSVALEDGRRYYLPVGHKGGGNLDRGLVQRWLERELRDKDLYVAEGKIDIQLTRKAGIDLEAQGCRPREIQYRAALLSDKRRSFALDDLAFDTLGKRKKDLERDRIWELPSYEVGPYAEEDAALTLETGLVLDKEIDTQNLREVCNLEDDLLYCVCEMERNGVPLNIPKLTGWRQEIKRFYQEAVFEAHRQTGIKANPNSSQDLAKVFDALNLKYGRTEATPAYPEGQPSFTDAFLKTVEHPVVANLRKARSLSSLDSKYISKYYREQRNGYLYYKLHQLKVDEEDYGLFGTISGRFSSSSVNIQQVYKPSRQAKKFGHSDFLIRELFIPRPGRLWFKADARQIEFRLFVHYANSKRLIQRYIDDPLVDFHDVVMQMVSIIRAISRDDAKNVNFAKLYVAGVHKLSLMIGCSESQARSLVEAYDEAFPEARALAYMAMNLAEKRGWVKTILGRMARFEPGDRFYSALNRVIQGTAADIMKLKLLEVYRERKFLDFHMFFTVHDELDGDVGSEAKALEIKKLLDTQIRRLKLRVPILWDSGTGENWAKVA